MKRLGILLVSILLCGTSHTQIVRGVILDRQTESPVWFASVYFTGTFVGTATDETGTFELDISKHATMPLTISAVGYYSTTLTDFSIHEPLVVYLTPKVYELKEVVISAKSLARERRRNLRIFINEFLGTTVNAGKCEILNENDITFNYYSDDDTLKAFASKPILIENRALGYKITYYLDRFEYYKNTNTIYFTGNIIFNDDYAGNERQKDLYEKRRVSAYQGSRMHFFRALWADNLRSGGFSLKDPGDERIKLKDIVILGDSSRKFLARQDDMNIEYYGRYSFMEFLKDSIYFDRNGYFDPAGVRWLGEMSKKRIADMLPYEFIMDIPDRRQAGNVNLLNTSRGDSLKLIEKVYLHTDREFYGPGDDLWFKAYLVDASSRIPANISNNLHVDLISPNSEILVSRVIRCDQGLGHGDFTLPAGLKTGNYRLRAYTNYMRNLSDSLFFWKGIHIFNSNEDVVVKDPIRQGSAFEINFFPEGGSLVENVPSRIAFMAVDRNGKGCGVSGSVFSSAGERITDFTSSHLGMGSFTLEPLPGIHYHALVRNTDGDTVTCNLPSVFLNGIVMHISNIQQDVVAVTFKTNGETLPTVMDRDLSMTVSARNVVYRTYNIRMKSQNSYLRIPLDDLPGGIIMLTLSGNGMPLCERLVYIRHSDDLKLQLETDKKFYKQRDSVAVRVSLPEYSGIEADIFLSLSVAESIFTRDSSGFPSTISSWFLLESDIRGPVEDPGYYFDASNPGRLENLDLVMLTQGWRDFAWKYDTLKYMPEKGFSVSGRLRKTSADEPIGNTAVSIGLFDNRRPFITYVTTDTAGRFRLDGINFNGEAKLIVSAMEKKARTQGQLSLDPSGYTPPPVRDGSLENTWQVNAAAQQLMKQMAAANLPRAINSNSLPDENQDLAEKQTATNQAAHVQNSRTFYAKPDMELIVTPQLYSYPNSYRLIGSTIMKSRGFKNPVYMIDGMTVSGETVSTIPVRMIDRIDVLYSDPSLSAMGPQGPDRSASRTASPNPDGTRAPGAAFSASPVRRIERVDIMNTDQSLGASSLQEMERYTSGNRVTDVVYNIITKADAAMADEERVTHLVNTSLSGYSESRVFYSPQYSRNAAADTLPDMRTTLFWEPDIVLAGDEVTRFRYFNADHPAVIRIIAEGITSDGIPVTGSTTYQVK